MHGDEDEAAREDRARSHPTRTAILSLFDEGEAELTVAQVHSQLDGEPNLRDLYYHLRVLVACRLLSEEDGLYTLP
jgi:Helix-turn-helix domain